MTAFFGGNSRTITDLWKDGSLTLYLSQDIFDEYIEVLRRLGLDNTPEMEEMLKLFDAGVNGVPNRIGEKRQNALRMNGS